MTFICTRVESYILRRVKTIISSTPSEMRTPITITKNLYFESHYDTETLLKILMQVLDMIGCDYSNIKLINKKNCQNSKKML